MDDSDTMQQFAMYSPVSGGNSFMTYEEGLAEIDDFFPDTVDPAMDGQQHFATSPSPLPAAERHFSPKKPVGPSLLGEQSGQIEATDARDSFSGNDQDVSTFTFRQQELDPQSSVHPQTDQPSPNAQTPRNYEAWPLEDLVNEAQDRGYRGSTRKNALVPWLQNNDHVLATEDINAVHTAQDLGRRTARQLRSLVQAKYPAHSSGKMKRGQCISLLTAPTSRASPSTAVATRASTKRLDAATPPAPADGQSTEADPNNYDGAGPPAVYDSWTLGQLKSEIIQRGGVCGGSRETKMQWLKDYDDVAAAGGVADPLDRGELGRKYMPELRKLALYRFPHVTTGGMKKGELVQLLAPAGEEEVVDEGEAQGD